MKNVKIRVPKDVPYTYVIEYLESLGYKMLAGAEEQYVDRAHYYGSGDDEEMSYTTSKDEKYFVEHAYEEIFLPSFTIRKPPIGLRPKSTALAVYRADRLKEIFDAMQRYLDADVKIPQAWVLELEELNNLYGVKS